MPTSYSPSARDPRVDFLRGLSLLSIFVDHIPKNRLADFTLHNFGFCDAAELFVILAGFSASSAYTRVFERDGLKVGLLKVLSRCLQIYGVQILLLLTTWAFVSLWQQIYGTQSLILGPMLRDGWLGAVRGLSLQALPTYLDILPLYIVLLAAFPLIRFGMARSPAATLGMSIAIYGAANLFRWDLPNRVDPGLADQWYFNPFTWQIVFVFGCWFASATRRRLPVMTAPPTWLVALCCVYALAALVVVDAWKLWSPPFGDNPNGITPVITVFGNEPKSFVTPWRLLNVLAWTYLALSSATLIGIARWRIFAPVVACGRRSLQVFTLGCVLSLFGRLAFRSYEVTALSQILVNVVGLGTMLVVGWWLDMNRIERAKSRPTEMGIDAKRFAE